MRRIDRVLIAGAGPVGLVTAGVLVQRGVPVTVLEAGSALSTESRASTFHPPTLDMLDDIGAARPLIEQGVIAPTLQYRTRDEVLATFDFSAIADATRHPYRLQAEQFKLTRILHDLLRENSLFEIAFDSPVTGVTQSGDEVVVAIGSANQQHVLAAPWLVGADGASSAVRKLSAIEFEGFTWPERFLVISTPFNFDSAIRGLAAVTYVADPGQWHFFLRVPGMWRMMFPVPQHIDDTIATSDDYVQEQMAVLVPGKRGYEVAHTTLYRVHQRVARAYRSGRVFLAGDAAHVNNPLGGMGMNGGIHDAVNLATRLADVWQGRALETSLEGYERQRRTITVEFVQAQTIQNKQNLEAKDPAAHSAFKERIRAIAADADRTRAYLRDLAMISSLSRAAEL